MTNISTIHQEFPILQRVIYDKPLIYFDNAATTQKPQVVIDKIVQGYTTSNANVHRGVHFLSQEATTAHETARERVRQFIGAAQSKEIIFTRGTTEGINLVASSFGDLFLPDGSEIILSAMEHHANIVPWQLLQRHKKITLRIVPINEVGELDMAVYRSYFNANTRLVAMTHASNVLGTINDVKALIDIAHSHEVPVLIDGAQAVQHIPVNVQELDVDFYLFSAHKVYGPTGVGVLYGKEKWLDAMPPYQGGGEMIERVTFEKTTFNALPYKFEAGTPDYIGSTALAAALDWVTAIGLDKIAQHEDALMRYATDEMLQIDGLKIYGTSAHKSGVISFSVSSIHNYDIGLLLDKLGIAVRTGHHCAQPLMQVLGVEGVVRVSFAVYNTKQEVDAFIKALRRVVEMLG